MLSGASSSLNGPLSSNLQKTLQDVLVDLSLDNDSMVAGSPNFNLLGPQSTLVSPLNLLSSNLTAASRSLVASSAAARAERPSVALGLTSEELLRAAALERQVLDQRAATVAALRQQALAEESMKQQQNRFTESLQSLMQGGSSMLGQHHGFVNPSSLAQLMIQQSGTIAPKMDAKETLVELGTSSKKKNVPYVDASTLTDPDLSKDSVLRKTRGGVIEPFPEKLHRMLQEVEDDGKTDIVSFFSHGRAFAVHDADRFVSEIMPKYFKQSKMSSFQRQLNLYGFTRINSGPDVGGYYHELFLKGRPALCIPMRRVGVSKGENRQKERELNARREPDFYSMRAVSSHS